MATIEMIAESLESRRKEIRMRRGALREAAGVARQTLVNVLNGSHDYRVSTLLSLADRLDLEVVLVPRVAKAAVQTSASPPVVMTRVRRALIQGAKS